MAVLGIGAGLFVIIFFGIISAAICVLGARSKVPGFDLCFRFMVIGFESHFAIAIFVDAIPDSSILLVF
jgi:hypothetical protein